MSGRRSPAVAGQFYPADPAELAETVDALLAGAPAAPGPAPVPKALVVPHAGYVYSGPVAASGYELLRADPRRRVLLIGPSHFVPLHGLVAAGRGRGRRRWVRWRSIRRRPGSWSVTSCTPRSTRWRCSCPSCSGCWGTP